MKRAQRTPGARIGRYFHMWPAVITALAVKVLTLTFFAPARAADHPRGLSFRVPDVIRLAEEPRAGRVYDLTFSPKANSTVCAFAVEDAVEVWDMSAKPGAITRVTILRRGRLPCGISPRVAESLPSVTRKGQSYGSVCRQTDARFTVAVTCCLVGMRRNLQPRLRNSTRPGALH